MDVCLLVCSFFACDVCLLEDESKYYFTSTVRVSRDLFGVCSYLGACEYLYGLLRPNVVVVWMS